MALSNSGARRGFMGWMVAVVAGTAMCGVSQARPDDPEDEELTNVFADGVPRVWGWTKPPSGLVSTDARFRGLAAINMFYSHAGSTPDGTVPRDGSNNADRRGASVGAEIAKIADADGAAPWQIAVLINGLGWGNQRKANGTYIQETGNSRHPSLYTHEDDVLVDSDALYDKAMTPWMNSGIAELSAWTAAFITGYNSERSAQSEPAVLNRIHQDQEPPAFDNNRTGFNFKTYWCKIKDDARFNQRVSGVVPDNARVPGYPDQTLSEIWVAAGSPAPVSTNDAEADKINNRPWWRWYTKVLKQVQSVALEEAVFAPLRSEYGTLGSDFDGTLKLDGGNSGNNSYLSGGWYPLTSGFNFAWDGKGDLQALAMYGVTTSYGVEGNPALGTNYVNPAPMVRSLDDGVTYGTPYTLQHPEPCFEASLRQHRYSINACARSYSGANADKIVCWLPMVGQWWRAGGGLFYNASSNPSVLPRNYNTYFYRIPDDGVRRLMMLAKSRGVKELLLWNETYFYDASNNENWTQVKTTNSHQWDRAKALVDQVWKYEATAASVDTGSLSGTAASLNLAPDSLLQHTSAANQDGTLTVTFSNDYGSSKGLRLNVEAESTKAGRISAEINVGGTWTTVDLDPTNAATDLAVAADKRVHVSGRLLHPSSTFSGSTFSARVKFTGTIGLSGDRVVKYDLVQIAADDDVHRLAGDFDGDGSVTGTDAETFEDMFRASCHTNLPADINGDGYVDWTDEEEFEDDFEHGGPSADFNRDGFPDFTDESLFMSFFLAEYCNDAGNINYFLDVNYDGAVDMQDWADFFAAHGCSGSCDPAMFE